MKDLNVADLPPRLDPVGITWKHDALPRVLPADWAIHSVLEDGASYTSRDGLVVIVSSDVELDGKRWQHLSVSRSKPTPQLPSWLDLRRSKEIFMGKDVKAVQILPAES